MRIIISPAKKMNINTDLISAQGMPFQMDKTEQLMNWMKSKSLEEAKSIWKCNDSLARVNYDRFQQMDLYKNLSPAILSYEGIQYQYMAPAVFEDKSFQYIQEHLRILSGFYGVLKAFDGVTPYRLEMQAKIDVSEYKDLYSFWSDSIYKEVIGEKRLVLNLASKEYSKCISKYLQPEDKLVTCIFAENVNGKMVQKGTFAKMARGEMVRFLAERQSKNIEDAKEFNHLGYRFDESLSSENEYLFIKEN